MKVTFKGSIDALAGCFVWFCEAEKYKVKASFSGVNAIDDCFIDSS